MEWNKIRPLLYRRYAVQAHDSVCNEGKGFGGKSKNLLKKGKGSEWVHKILLASSAIKADCPAEKESCWNRSAFSRQLWNH